MAGGADVLLPGDGTNAGRQECLPLAVEGKRAVKSCDIPPPGAAKLELAIKSLRVTLSAVETQWTDQTHHKFHEEHLAPIEPTVRKMSTPSRTSPTSMPPPNATATRTRLYVFVTRRDPSTVCHCLEQAVSDATRCREHCLFQAVAHGGEECGLEAKRTTDDRITITGSSEKAIDGFVPSGLRAPRSNDRSTPILAERNETAENEFREAERLLNEGYHARKAAIERDELDPHHNRDEV